MASSGLNGALATVSVASSKGGSDTSLGPCSLPAYPMLGGTMAPDICQAVESEQTAESLTLSERRWRCGGCGAVNDRDANASLNLETWLCEFVVVQRLRPLN